MPNLFFLAALIFGPGAILVLRIGTWVARALGYPRNPRPGYLDLTPPTAPPRARKEPT